MASYIPLNSLRWVPMIIPLTYWFRIWNEIFASWCNNITTNTRVQKWSWILSFPALCLLFHLYAWSQIPIIGIIYTPTEIINTGLEGNRIFTQFFIFRDKLCFCKTNLIFLAGMTGISLFHIYCLLLIRFSSTLWRKNRHFKFYGKYLTHFLMIHWIRSFQGQ